MSVIFIFTGLLGCSAWESHQTDRQWFDSRTSDGPRDRSHQGLLGVDRWWCRRWMSSCAYRYLFPLIDHSLNITTTPFISGVYKPTGDCVGVIHWRNSLMETEVFHTVRFDSKYKAKLPKWKVLFQRVPFTSSVNSVSSACTRDHLLACYAIFLSLLFTLPHILTWRVMSSKKAIMGRSYHSLRHSPLLALRAYTTIFMKLTWSLMYWWYCQRHACRLPHNTCWWVMLPWHDCCLHNSLNPCHLRLGILIRHLQMWSRPDFRLRQRRGRLITLACATHLSRSVS